MSYLQRLIEYNNWANQGLLEFLATVPPPVLDERVPGVFGSIRETFEHILSSELNYERRLTVPQMPKTERPQNPDLAVLQSLADESVRRLSVLKDALPDPGTMIELDDGQRGAATILTQLFAHGCEHRAHIGSILGALGIEGPELDSWAHGIFVHGDSWPADWGAKLDPMPRFPPPGYS